MTPTRRSRLSPILLRGSAVVLCAFALAGCGTVRGWFKNDKEKATAPAELTDIATSVAVQKLWSANAGKGEGLMGARQAPAVADGRVYAAAVKGGVRAFDLQTGSRLWHYESDLELSGGPGVGDGVVAVGGLEGDVIALDAATGAERWTAKVPNEVIAAPVIGQGMVYVRSNDGRVTAFDIDSGERRWFWNHEVPMLSVRGNGAPLLGPGLLFSPNDDGTVTALIAGDGRPVWELPVGQQDGRTELDRMADADGTPVLDGSTLFATSFKGSTVAIDAPTGQPMWAAEHGSVGRLAAGYSVLALSTAAGTVFGVDKSSGAALWQQPALARRNLSAPAVQGDYAVVGDFEGYLHWMQLYNGDFAARVRAGRDPIRAAPVVADGVLVVQDIEGKLSAYRLGQ